MTARDPLTLASLFARLRAHRIPVGCREAARLHDAFAAQPGRAHGNELRALLRCTLAKTQTERAVFERAFDDWLAEAKATLEQGLPEQASPLAESPPVSPERAAVLVQWRIDDYVDPAGARQRRARRRGIAMGVLALGGIALVIIGLLGTHPSEPPDPTPAHAPVNPDHTNVVPSPADVAAQPLAADVLTSVDVPYLSVRSTTPLPPAPGTPHLLALATVALFVGTTLRLVFRARARALLVAKQLEPTRDGSLPAPPLQLATEELLEPSEARAMVYGVDRFVADELTERIDVARSVDASVRAAAPILVHERPRLDRAVWLFCDTAGADRKLARLRREVARRLLRAGLEVRTAHFYDTPSVLRWDDDDSVFALETVDGHREQTILLVLTHGHGLQRALQDNLQQATLRHTLRSLASWPRLAVVDFDPAATATMVAREFGLQAIAPEAVPRFLADREGALAREPVVDAADDLHGELRLWAAALAMSPQPFDEEAAYALRRALALSCATWELDAVLAIARASGSRYRFAEVGGSAPTRLDLLDWLANAERHHEAGRFVVAADTMLAQALRFWREHGQRQALAVATGPSHESREATRQRARAQQALRLEAALLSLFDAPAEALAGLRALAAAGLADQVRLRLRAFVPGDYARAGATCARVPWRMADVAGEVREGLADLGLGEGVVEREPPCMPRSLWLLCGLAGIAGLGAVAFALLRPAHGRPAAWLDPVDLPPHATVVPSLSPANSGVLALQLRATKNQSQTTVEPNGLSQLQIVPDANSNPRVLEGMEVWRAGRNAGARRPQFAGWPVPNVLWVVAANVRDPDWQSCAHRLLDSGSVDIVVLANAAPRRANWPTDVPGPRPDGMPKGNPAWQLLVAYAGEGTDVTSIDLDADHLAVMHRASPADLQVPPRTPRSVAEAWRGLVMLTVQGKPQLAAGPTLEAWITIPAGTFQLGSPPYEKGRFEDEGPIPDVEIGAFQMMQHEVTRASWRSVMKREPKEWRGGAGGNIEDDSLPANHVSWFDALEFCNALSAARGLPACYELAREGGKADAKIVAVRWHRDADGYRLPTEAEWEYAVRAKASPPTPYPWREGEDGLDAHAWWSSNSGGKVHTVGGKPANAWGLYDMIGNVWEWCWDEAPQRSAEDTNNLANADPHGRDGDARAGVARVLRGGSFDLGGARVLRSAYRNRNEPRIADELCGFRCVRAPIPQHPSKR